MQLFTPVALPPAPFRLTPVSRVLTLGSCFAQHIGPLRFKRTLRPADSGEVRIFLDSKLVNFDRPVTVRVNGTVRFEGRVPLTDESIAQSIDLFHDPLRLYPACVKVKWCKWGGVTNMDRK
ncbi:MAG: hypothetical protein HXL30_05025 [Prevotellaceae bacterium]|nr:hypothetical protein [Prevotellaceae bacterium]